MSSSKFYIYGGGRWREVEDGHVSGWTGCSFVYLKRGKLCIANRKAVIQGLKQLAIGRPSSVKVGIPLSQLKDEDLYESKISTGNQNANCSCRKKICCDTDAKFNRLLKPVTHTVAIQCSPTKNAFTQIITQAQIHDPAVSNKHRDIPKNTKERPIKDIISQNYCKELIIDETDVIMFRNFLEKDANNIFKVNLSRYDEDDDYKKIVFYKINPLVNVIRDKNIQKILNQQTNLDRIEFAQLLGLKSINDDKTSKRKRNNKNKEIFNKMQKINNVKTNKENVSNETSNCSHSIFQKNDFLNNNERQVQIEIIRPDLRNDNFEKSDVVTSKISGESSLCKTKKPLGKWIGNSSRTGRDYSRIEDDAIVTWILNNGKANFVNGNRVWKALQPIHQANTGQARSWHSLRNRYLRYILPSLGSMSLPQAEITTLRAAASAGEIKARKIQRRNSIFKTTQVKSAFTARPQTKSQDGEEKKIEDQSSTPRPLRSNTKVSPSRNKLPTYSEITRRFALRHRSTPNSVESDPQTTKNDHQATKNDRQATINDGKISENDRHSSKNTKMEQLKGSIDKNGEITIEIEDSDEDNNKNQRDSRQNSKISDNESGQINNIRIRLMRDKRGRYLKAKIVDTQNQSIESVDSSQPRRKSKRLHDTDNENSIENNQESQDDSNYAKKRRSEVSRKIKKIKIRARQSDASKINNSENNKNHNDSSEESNFKSRSSRREKSKFHVNSNNQVRKTLPATNIKEKSNERQGRVENSDIDSFNNKNLIKSKDNSRKVCKSSKSSRSKTQDESSNHSDYIEDGKKSRKREKRLRRENKLQNNDNASDSTRSIDRRNETRRQEKDKLGRQDKEKQQESKNNRQDKDKISRQKSDKDTSKRLADESERQAKKPRIQYESDLSDFEPVFSRNASSEDSNVPQTKSLSKLRLQFEDDTSSGFTSDSSSPKNDRQTRLSKYLSDKSSKNDNDRQRRTRRLFNPTAFMNIEK